MGEQRIIQQADGWHFKIRGGNTIGPFTDRVAAELAVASYCDRWKQRTDVSPGRWRNWRRSPRPLATVAATLRNEGGSEQMAAEIPSVMRNSS